MKHTSGRGNHTGDRHTAPRTVTRALSWIRESDVRSLMDWDETQWLEFCHVARKGYQSLSYAFIRDTRFELQRLLIADDPWGDQFPRDSWDLRLLDLATENQIVVGGQVEDVDAAS